MNLDDSGVDRPMSPAERTAEAPLARNAIRLLLLGFGLLDALTFDCDKAVSEYGLVGAITNTLGISVIVWAALYFCATNLMQEKDAGLTRREGCIYMLALLTFMIPVKHISWVGLALVSLGILTASREGSPAAKGAWILLAVTVPMFWSKLVFSLLSGLILQVDAMLVSAMLGIPRNGNTLTLADGRTQLFIGAPCSSMANVSLVVLCWTLFCQQERRGASGTYLWCIFACLAIVAINVGRISLIGLFPGQYALLHGPFGASVASWIILFAMVSIFKFGMNRGH